MAPLEGRAATGYHFFLLDAVDETSVGHLPHFSPRRLEREAVDEAWLEWVTTCARGDSGLSLTEHLGDDIRGERLREVILGRVHKGSGIHAGSHSAWSQGGRAVILPKDRNPAFITIRRGGTLTDSDHRLLAVWAAACAEHVLHLFEPVQPSDPRPRQAIEQIRAWACGEIRMSQSRAAGGHAMAAARELSGAAPHAAYADRSRARWSTQDEKRAAEAFVSLAQADLT